HFRPAKNSFSRHMKKHHMAHHFADSTKSFGVSTPAWDIVFGTSAERIAPRLAGYFLEYADHHLDRGNKICHYVGLPMVIVSIVGLLARLRLGVAYGQSVDAGALAVLLATVWYFHLDWKISLPFTLVSAGLYAVSAAAPVPVLVAFFPIGWA